MAAEAAAERPKDGGTRVVMRSGEAGTAEAAAGRPASVPAGGGVAPRPPLPPTAAVAHGPKKSLAP